MNQDLKLPRELLMGTATAATHIEGGRVNSNWYDWSERGKIMDGSHCKRACDHLNRIEDDVNLLGQLNCDTYRLGLDWARIEPSKGKFDYEALNLYARELDLLAKSNVRPLVTLWHFSNPMWFEQNGGWTHPDAVNCFLRYVENVVQQLGDRVTDWITINEPNVYLFFGYFDGIWPPGKKGDIRGFLKGASNLCLAHIRAYDLIHSKLKGAKVGVAHHLRVFDPVDSRWISHIGARLQEFLFQSIFLEAMTTGRFRLPLINRSVQVPSDTHYADFIGINYYTRDFVKGNWNPMSFFGNRNTHEDLHRNDLGWEIYPEGIGRICRKVFSKYKIPIYITENGICDHKDVNRSRFIYDHLRELITLYHDGISIERYYHWTLMDNWEWVEGEKARFGLFENDFETQTRTLRKSGSVYARVCRERQFKWDWLKDDKVSV